MSLQRNNSNDGLKNCSISRRGLIGTAASFLAMAMVVAATMLTVGSSIVSAEMPGLNEEVQLISVAPGQRIEFEINFKSDEPRGLSLWFHDEERLFAFWGNQPHRDEQGNVDPRGWDLHGGLVNPCRGGRNGTFHWTNKNDAPVVILVHAWNGGDSQSQACGKLKLLGQDDDNNVFVFGGCNRAETTYNKIGLKVKIINPTKN
jgi:hypothetical protein